MDGKTIKTMKTRFHWYHLMLLFTCRWPVNSLHKWPVMWKMFPFDDVIMSILTNVSWESPSGFAYNLITADGALTYVFKVNYGLIHSSCAPFFQDYTTTASSHWPRFYIVTLFRIRILWIIIDWILRNIPAQICSGFLTVGKIMSTQQRGKRLNIFTRMAKILRFSKMAEVGSMFSRSFRGNLLEISWSQCHGTSLEEYGWLVPMNPTQLII